MFLDNLVTRFPNGVNNAPLGVNDIFNSLKGLDPTQYHTFFDDFDFYTAADWTVTEVGTATQALTDVDGGVLLISNSAGIADSSYQQKVGSSFQPKVGKKIYFETQFAVSDATQSVVVAGLQVTDTTPLDATDGIYFTKADGSTEVSIVCRRNATTGSVTAVVGNLDDNTYARLAFFYDGDQRLYYAMDKVVLGYLTVATSSNGAPYLPDTILTPSFGIGNGEAVIKTMSMDYIFAAKDRTGGPDSGAF
jgi:hypothetical protein